MRCLAQNHKLIHMACGGMKSKAIFQYTQANGLFIMPHSDSVKSFYLNIHCIYIDCIYMYICIYFNVYVYIYIPLIYIFL